jgi:hypothetical protein
MRCGFSLARRTVPCVEAMESRQLLSVSLALHALQVTSAQQVGLTSLLGTYSGFLDITRSGGVPIGTRPNVILAIGTQSAGGALTGVLNVAGFGPISVSGNMTNTRFTLTSVFDPNNPGNATYTGTIGSSGASLNGTLFEFFGDSSVRGALFMTKVHGPPPTTPTTTVTTAPIQSPGAGAGLSSIFGTGSAGAGAGNQPIGTVNPPVPGSSPIIITSLGTATTSSGVTVGLFSLMTIF